MLTAKLNQAIKLCALCAVMAMLPGCGDLFTKPAPMHIITMHTYAADAPLCQSRLPLQLVVSTPDTYAGLNTDRIAMLLNDREIQYASEYKWDTPAPVMIQHMLVDALNTSGCFVGAGTERTGLGTPYRLMIDLQRMHFMRDEHDKESVQVQFQATMLNVENGSIIAMRNITDARGGSYSDAITLGQAMEDTLHEVVKQTVMWSYETLSAYQPAPRDGK